MPFLIQETVKLYYVKKKKVISILVKTCKQNQNFFGVHEVITQRLIDETN